MKISIHLIVELSCREGVMLIVASPSHEIIARLHRPQSGRHEPDRLLNFGPIVGRNPVIYDSGSWCPGRVAQEWNRR